MAPFAEVRAVFFDLDDTLCGYWDACKIALRETFAEHGPDGHDVEALVRHWAAAFRGFAPNLRQLGMYETYLTDSEPTRTEQMRRTLQRLELEDEERAARLSQHYMERRDANLCLFPDALPLLDRLREEGYRMGLITNGPADIQRQEVATLGIADYFDPIYIEGEVGYGKPDSRVLKSAAEAVGEPPERILFVGNSYGHDIRPAIEAGWKTAWIRRASDVPPSADENESLKPEERPAGAPAPDVEIGELSQLIPLLGLP
ncbi:HAD family hydrolase [bacterium]|nr:MAG: HAD family hydrolase [bacterium]